MTRQLVVSRDRAGSDVLTLVPESRDEHSAHEQDYWTPVLGTYDLLRIANFATTRDFYLDEVRAIGADGAPLDAEATEDLNAVLRPHIDDVADAAALLRRSYPGYTLVSIILTTPTMHHLQVRRMGDVETDNPLEAEAALQEAWRTLELS